jgi:hypothetical protein
MNQGLTKNFNAGAAVGKRLLVKFGADGKTVVQAAAATDKIIGASVDIDSAIGEPCDVAFGDIVPVIAGGNITRGDLVTSDANGKAVTAAPAAGANNRIAGIAMDDAVAGDLVDVFLKQGSVQG